MMVIGFRTPSQEMTMKTISAIALAAALGLAATAAPALAFGPGHGHGMGMGMDGTCAMMGGRDTPLTTTQVKDIIEGRLAMHGEDAKVGKVQEKDAYTVTAEVQKADGKSRVLEVNRVTGHMKRID